MSVTLWHYTHPDKRASIRDEGFRGNPDLSNRVYFCRPGETEHELRACPDHLPLQVELDITEDDIKDYGNIPSVDKFRWNPQLGRHVEINDPRILEPRTSYACSLPDYFVNLRIISIRELSSEEKSQMVNTWRARLDP